MKNRDLIFGLDSNKYSLGRGRFFDAHSYVSGFKFIVQGFLCYFIVKNLPSTILHLSLLFNFEFSIPSPSATRTVGGVPALAPGSMPQPQEKK